MSPYNKGKGKGYALIVANAGHEGDQCLIWPMSRNNYGYGQLGHEGKLHKAHRLMCTVAHGEPPSPIHYAAHSCGMGHLGCYNPRHLSWKTPSENVQEAVEHGAVRQPGGPRRKLTEDQVAQIKAAKGIRTQAALAKMFNVRPETIRKIFNGEIRTGAPAKPNRAVDPAIRVRLKLRAMALRNKGLTLDKIGADLGVTRATVVNYLKTPQ